MSNRIEKQLEEYEEKFPMPFHLTDRNYEVMKSFLSSSMKLAQEERDKEWRVVAEGIKKCVFESDGEKHCCVSPCEGVVENCIKCHRDRCSNINCPLGKGVDNNNVFNSALDTLLKAMEDNK